MVQREPEMKVVIIGTGYVGLVSGVCFAEIGHNVICVDIDHKKIESINKCKSHIYEEGLDDLLRSNVTKGRLTATTNLKEAIIDADITMIAVGTPFTGDFIDLTYIKQAATDIGDVLEFAPDFHVVCVKSTVVQGTTENVVGKIIEERSSRRLDENIGLCMNPEFLAEGTAVSDFMNPDRIVIGASDSKTSKIVQQLYAQFDSTDMILTTPATAEMIKYTANAFLATVISYANEIANLCSSIGGIDAIDVMQGVYADKRLSPILPEGRVTPGLMSFLYPGTGFGGSCFPKDLKALISYADQYDYSLEILKSVFEVNQNQPSVTVDLLIRELGDLIGKRIAVLGLAFKPGTDDVRESPSITIIQQLLANGAFVVAHDPIAIENMKAILFGKSLTYVNDLPNAVNNVDAIVLVTSWPEYHDLSMLLKSNEIPIIDGRRFLDKKQFDKYSGIGLNNNLQVS